jgi:prepilin-type N-terminal cleavage/methylation domain-containing protein
VICNQKGLTLVEVLVSGTIGAIIATMVLSAMSVEMAAASEGIANARLLGHARSVSAQLGESVHAGNLALKPGEAWSSEPVDESLVQTNEIRLYDTSGTIIAAYQISDNILKESSDGETWSPFVAGGFAVNVSDVSCFELSADRKTVVSKIELSTTHKNSTYTLSIQGDMFRCRN